MNRAGFREARRVNGVLVLGPELFVRNGLGEPLSPLASVFPRYRAVVAGRGIHAMLAQTLVEFLQEHPGEAAAPFTPQDVYEDAMAVLVHDPHILVRSVPSDMERVFAADELLQRLWPKEIIQFTGIHQPEVRRAVRRRGESWRISPHPRTPREIVRRIRSSRVHVHTGAVYYHNVPRGGRYLTREEFMRIRPLLRRSPPEACARIREILQLSGLRNKLGARELSLFLPCDEGLDLHPLEGVAELLESAGEEGLLEAELIFDRFAECFAKRAAGEFFAEDKHNPAWRTAMFCRLFDIEETTLEEWSLGLSPEFHLNVRWLPGARLEKGGPVFEEKAEPRVRSIIQHFVRTRHPLLSINVGRVESPQTERTRTGERREVYIVVLGLGDGGEALRLVRMMKWDVFHRLQCDIPLPRAIEETYRYRDYILDRLDAARKLGISIPEFREIRLQEEIPNIGTVPVFLFEREYVVGKATDKIPLSSYARPGFIVQLAGLLAVGAAASLAIGRASPQTGEYFFDDGDEVIQFCGRGLPECLIVSETTGSFNDCRTPMAAMLPHYLKHLASHLETARRQGVDPKQLEEAVEAFQNSLAAEIRRMQKLLEPPKSPLRSLFDDRSREEGGIRRRWELLLQRLESTDAEELLQVVRSSPKLEPYRSP